VQGMRLGSKRASRKGCPVRSTWIHSISSALLKRVQPYVGALPGFVNRRPVFQLGTTGESVGLSQPGMGRGGTFSATKTNGDGLQLLGGGLVKF